MFFSIHDLELRKIHFDVVFPPGEIDLLDSTLTQVGGLKATGVVEMANHTIGEIRIKGNLRAVVKSPCDRCLEPAEYSIDSPFDLSYRPTESEPEAGEVALNEDESEIGFYEGLGLQLTDVLREVVVLELPMRILCSEDCKGICATCGQNRNIVNCECKVRPADDRWSALQNLQ